MKTLQWAVLAALVATPAAAEPLAWTPTAAQILELEAAIALPAGYSPLDQYARYYRPYSFSGRHTVNGELVHLSEYRAGVYIVDDESKWPRGIADGGCNIVQISYDFEAHRIIGLKCNLVR